jgi:hypothetical protein
VNTAETALGALGGLAAFIGLVWLVVRGLIGWARSVDANTSAIRDLTDELHEFGGRLDNQESRLSYVEGKVGARPARPPRVPRRDRPPT